jgi:hypothetical protein
MARFDLSDAERAVIEPLLPTDLRGQERVDDRRVLNGIFWRPSTGAPWAMGLAYKCRSPCRLMLSSLACSRAAARPKHSLRVEPEIGTGDTGSPSQRYEPVSWSINSGRLEGVGGSSGASLRRAWTTLRHFQTFAPSREATLRIGCANGRTIMMAP